MPPTPGPTFPGIWNVPRVPFAPGAQMMFPSGPSSLASVGPRVFTPALSPMGNMISQLQNIGPQVVQNPSRLTAIRAGGLAGLKPVGGFGAAARALPYAFAGQIGGGLIEGFAGGPESTERNKFAEFGRGAIKGAGAGAAAGSVIPVIGTGVGAGIGGVLGGVADVLDVTSWFGGGKKDPEKTLMSSLSEFNKLLNQFAGADTPVKSWINQQMLLQTEFIRSDDTLSESEKEEAYKAAVETGKQYLSAYVQSPNQFKMQLGLGGMGMGGPGNYAITPQDQLALQALYSEYLGPIADSIEATGQQTSAIYGERAGEIGGERGAALNFQGQAVASGAQQLADAYRAQASMIPTMQTMQYNQGIQNQLNQQQQQQWISAMSQAQGGYGVPVAGVGGYGDQSFLGGASTDPETDALLAQIAGG